MTFAAVLRSNSRSLLELERAALTATRDRLGAKVTGIEELNPGRPSTPIRFLGVTGAEVSRIADLNGKIAAVDRRLAEATR